jgi:hypothetical protein
VRIPNITRRDPKLHAVHALGIAEAPQCHSRFGESHAKQLKKQLHTVTRTKTGYQTINNWKLNFNEGKTQNQEQNDSRLGSHTGAAPLRQPATKTDQDATSWRQFNVICILGCNKRHTSMKGIRLKSGMSSTHTIQTNARNRTSRTVQEMKLQNQPRFHCKLLQPMPECKRSSKTARITHPKATKPSHTPNHDSANCKQSRHPTPVP